MLGPRRPQQPQQPHTLEWEDILVPAVAHASLYFLAAGGCYLFGRSDFAAVIAFFGITSGLKEALRITGTAPQPGCPGCGH